MSPFVFREGGWLCCVQDHMDKRTRSVATGRAATDASDRSVSTGGDTDGAGELHVG